MKQHVIDHAYALLSRRTPDWSLDQPFYVDQDIFDLEMKLFLGRQWLFAALACEIPQAGDWVRVDIGRESIVIVRRKDGGIGAYHNTCRHRGSRISLEERGHASHLVCPYHQWTYDLNGKLVGARLMGSDFDRYRAVRLPFTGGKASMTMDGRPASSKLLGDLTDEYLGSVQLLSLPNNWNHILADHAVTFRVLPLGPEETLVTTKWLVHKDARKGVDYDVDRLREIWAATNEQDKKLAEHNHLGVRGSAYRPGPYSELIEGGTREFIRWYVAEMLAVLAPLTPLGNVTRETTARDGVTVVCEGVTS